MARKALQFLSIVALLFANAPAMALNPQPLPPGRTRLFKGEQGRPHEMRRRSPHRILRCHGIRGGDPKKPPMRDCR